MATVYLARDLKHDRRVAVKVLNPELGAVLGVERFLGEIKVTANLQHPNLLPLFDSGEAAGQLFYVMPFVDGETLRARLAREKQLPVAEAVRIATAIASALEYAHEHGVIHRDLKPENILLQSGQPVIADFGIALAVSKAGGARVTQTGLSLGTPQYMSPEQAAGDRAIDARTDIYSLGAMTYEMLAGEAPHTGNTAQAIIAKLMTEDPRPLTVLRRSVPEHVDDAVQRALEKLPADRFATARGFIDALRATGSGTGARARTTGAARGSWRMKAVAAAGLVIAMVTSAGWWMAARRHSEGATVRFSLDMPRGFRLGTVVAGGGSPFAVSPDDRTIVYVGSGSGSPQSLWMRHLDELEGHPIAGAVVATNPMFSPDGKHLGFYATSGPKVMEVGTGTIVAVPRQPARPGVSGCAFAGNDRIVVTSLLGIEVVAVGNGDTRVIQPFADSTLGDYPRAPFVLTDGNTVFFSYTEPTTKVQRIAWMTIDGRHKATRLEVHGSSVLGYVDGILVYVSGDDDIRALRTDARSLEAVPFDPRTGKVGSAPVQVVDRVAIGVTGSALAALSASGTLIYQARSSESQVMLADLNGAMQPILKEPKGYASPRLSPDGRRLALTVSTGGVDDIWTYDFASKTTTKLSSVGGDRPEWTPDGKRVLFRSVSGRSTGYELWWQPADGSGPAELLLKQPTGDVWEGIVTPDAKTLVFRTGTVASARILMRALEGDTTVTPFHASQFSESAMRVSPDGRWMAYASNQSGTWQVYAQPTRDPGGSRVQISADGGDTPVWTRDGRRIFYTSGQKILVASLATGASLTVTDRKELFEHDVTLLPGHAGFDVMPDGQHLIFVKPVNGEAPATVVLNWRTELHALVSGRGAK